MKKDGERYSADQLVTLSDVEHVRKRPGMYLGGLEEFGRLNLLLIVLDDALMQVRAQGFANLHVRRRWRKRKDRSAFEIAKRYAVDESLSLDAPTCWFAC